MIPAIKYKNIKQVIKLKEGVYAIQLPNDLIILVRGNLDTIGRINSIEIIHSIGSNDSKLVVKGSLGRVYIFEEYKIMLTKEDYVEELI